jgi:predicted dehydrogenase
MVIKSCLLFLSLFVTVLPVVAQNLKTRPKGKESMKEVRLITLDPGHFHAALVQKIMYPGVAPLVHIYAPVGVDLIEHLKRIDLYNSRAENPTRWDLKVYKGDDFFNKMLAEKPGNVVVLAGNNQKKIDYINASLSAGLNVLSDKPMAIDTAGFEKLKKAFKTAEQKGVLLYDIMTERYEITTMLQKALVNNRAIFGELQKGTEKDPAVTKESVHHLFKYVSGKPLVRPAWFFDTKQQGEGIVDVTTHLVDLIQWEIFPDQRIPVTDVKIVSARRWPTAVTLDQFKKVTGLTEFPGYLKESIGADGALEYYSNGEINYTLKGVHSKVSVIWNFEAPQGAGDTHYSIVRGSRANVIIRQGSEEKYRPELYIEAVKGADNTKLESALRKAVADLQPTFPGIELVKSGERFQVRIPDKLRDGHEAHFGSVAEKYLRFLNQGKLPDWEVPNMITKYYTTTKAREIALEMGKR